MNVPKKLVLVTTSSIETEVVFDGENFTKCSWFRHFRLERGEEEGEDILMQDNESCALLHKHFTFYVGKGSNHAHVRHFFVVDKIEKNEVRIVHCPTENGG